MHQKIKGASDPTRTRPLAIDGKYGALGGERGADVSAGLGHSKCYGSRERRYRSASHVSKTEEVGHPAARYQDSNIWSERKLIEELRYMHRNPRGPAGSPEDWALEQLSPLCLWC